MTKHAMPELDARCENWGRWARTEAQNTRLARIGNQPAPFEWDPEWGDPYEHAPPANRDPINDVDAVTIDRAISKLAEQHRRNLRGFYVYFAYIPIGPYYAALRALDDRLCGRYRMELRSPADIQCR